MDGIPGIPSRSVAMLGSLPPERGISPYCLQLAQAVSEHFAVDFISFKAMYPAFCYPGGGLRPDDTFPEIDRPGLHVRRNLAWYNPLTWIWEGLRARGDALHVQFWSLPLAPICLTVMLLFRLRGRRCGVTIHNVAPHGRSILFELAIRILLRIADVAIVHTSEAAEFLAAKYGFPLDRVRVIPHGRLDLFAHGNLPAAGGREAKEAIRIPGNAPVVLFFGAIREYKGLDTLLAAFAQVKKEVADARLVIAGKLWVDWKPYDEIIKRKRLDDSVALFTDYIPTNRVKDYFQAADVVVLPYHRFDAQSGVGMTGLAFEKPMIVSDLQGLRELVRDKSFVLPPGDAESLANALARALGDPSTLERLGSDSKQIAKQYDWNSIARTTASMYDELVAGPHGSSASIPASIQTGTPRGT